MPISREFANQTDGPVGMDGPTQRQDTAARHARSFVPGPKLVHIDVREARVSTKPGPVPGGRKVLRQQCEPHFFFGVIRKVVETLEAVCSGMVQLISLESWMPSDVEEQAQ